MKLTAKEIKAMSNNQLVENFENVIVKLAKEENTKRGVTKQTSKTRQLLLDEMTLRFNLEIIEQPKKSVKKQSNECYICGNKNQSELTLETFFNESYEEEEQWMCKEGVGCC